MPKVATLEGVTIIDFTSMMAGPFASKILADCGATVVKIEPLSGDYMRQRSPIRDGRSSYYGQMNSGKKSLALELKTPEGRQIALDLIAKADVVVENFRPGVMSALGLGYETLQQLHPRLIYCAITGFGQKGSRARDPAYAPIIHAASGYDMAHLKYNEDRDRPPTTGIFMADVVSAIYAFGAIQTALLHRERFGVGQSIDVTLIDSMLNMLIFEMQEAQFKVEHRRPLYQPLKTLDGFVIVAPVSQKNFENLALAIEQPKLVEDSRFSNARAREQNWGLLMSLIEQWTQHRTAKYCEDWLMKAGVPSSRYNTVAALLEDEEMVARGTYRQCEDGSGSFTVPRQPFQFSQALVEPQPHVADLGEDTDAVLGRMLSLSPARIEELRAKKVLV